MKVTSSELPDSPKRQTNGHFIVTISEILVILTKQANRLKGKAKATVIKDGEWRIDFKTPKSALIKFRKKKMKKNTQQEEEWENVAVWQKEILMGGKCEPLDFSGVIYYDVNGKQTAEYPVRSPRPSPSPGYLTRR